MAQQAIGMIETKGLTALLEACDAALKAANVTLAGWEKIGCGYVTGFLPRRCRRRESGHRRRRLGRFPGGTGRQRPGHPASARRPFHSRQMARLNRR